jgi:hypothetical protein
MCCTTSFTPNHDGKNETLTPKMNGCRVESLRFMIYNRWGELVFESNFNLRMFMSIIAAI